MYGDGHATFLLWLSVLSPMNEEFWIFRMPKSPYRHFVMMTRIITTKTMTVNIDFEVHVLDILLIGLYAVFYMIFAMLYQLPLPFYRWKNTDENSGTYPKQAVSGGVPGFSPRQCKFRAWFLYHCTILLLIELYCCQMWNRVYYGTTVYVDELLWLH